MVGQKVRAARDGFDHGDAVGFGKGGQFGHRAGVLHAAARHDHRALGGAQQGGGLVNLGHVGRLAADAVEATREEGLRIVIGPALQVLRQAEEGRAAIGGVKQGGKGCGQGLQDLGGVGDAVPVAADGPEGVVQAQRGVPEMLQLLQHGVGQAGQEGITTEHQHRQAVGVGQGRRCEQVRRPRPRTGGAEHEAAAEVVFGIGSGGEAHALFVLTPVERQVLIHRIKRLAQTGDVAMAENAETAAANPGLFSVDHDILVHQPADDGLRHCQPEGGSGHGFCHGSSFQPRPQTGLAWRAGAGYIFCNRLQYWSLGGREWRTSGSGWSVAAIWARPMRWRCQRWARCLTRRCGPGWR